MPSYVRAEVPGAAYFFTVALDRRAGWLVSHVELLREAVGAVKRRHPSDIEAMVVLPEHLHALWRMPAGDANYAMRWMSIETRFTRRLRQRLATEQPRSRGELKVWQDRYWGHLCARRRGLCEPREVHPLQSGEAWTRSTRSGLAAFEFPSMGQGGAVARRLGLGACSGRH